MIAEKATESINQAVCYELQNIVKNHGAVYHSSHEGYAILKEEYEEAVGCVRGLGDKLDALWSSIKININNESAVEQGKQFAIALAEEAVQCAAVCEKLLETFGGINGDEK